MVQRTRNVFLTLWIATTMLFIGLVPQGRTDVSTASNKDDWMQTTVLTVEISAPSNATPEGVLFAGTDSAGIFRSTDLGDSWIPVNTGLPNEPRRRLYLYCGFRAKAKYALRWHEWWFIRVPQRWRYVASRSNPSKACVSQWRCDYWCPRLY